MKKYLSCFTFLFESPDWTTTFLWGSLMMFIPFVGPIVVSGWLVEVQHARLKDPNAPLPPLDFSRFGELLSLGVQPFLVAFLCVMPLMLMFYVLMGVVGGAVFVLVGVLGALLASALGEIGGILTLIIALLAGLLMMALTMIVMWAAGALIQVAVLRAEQTGNFGAAFDFGALSTNLKAMLKPLIVGNIVVGFGSMIPMFLGYMLCFVGFYPALFLISAAGSELRTIVYRDYLEAGHPPIA